MKKILFFVFALLFALISLEGKEQSVCLNMIVKNESKVIERCLRSAKPLIDYWVIVDTGSKDGTQEIIRNFLKDIPGELHERPWLNFEHNRNEALDLARKKSDYILIIDADEQFQMSNSFTLPKLDKDYYYITTKLSGTRYPRTQLFKSSLDWKWVGVLHEVLVSSQAHTSETLKEIVNIPSYDGCRSNDPDKFKKDAAILEAAIKKDPSSTRNTFYLAQSYRDAGETEKAIEWYQKRVDMGGWDQEIYWSLYQIALLQMRLKMPPTVFAKSLYKAHSYRPSRIEPIYHLANHYRMEENYLLGYLLAKYALSIPQPQDTLFIESWIYDHGLPMELSLSAYYIGKYQEAKEASEQILNKENIPDHIRTRVQENLTKWILPKLEQKPSISYFIPSNTGKIHAHPSQLPPHLLLACGKRPIIPN